MSINLPHSDSLSTNCLSQIFNNTVASYKYYWFLAILDIHVSAGKSKISIWDIIITMISDAWYPIHYFKLSFGKSDSMDCAIREIRRITGLPYDADKRQIQKVLKRYMDKGDKDLKKQLKIFTLNVPYRFLMPWIKTSDNKEMMLRSQSFENNALYALNVDADGDLVVQINPQWSDYLAQNYRILMDFVNEHLLRFLRSKNPDFIGLNLEQLNCEANFKLLDEDNTSCLNSSLRSVSTSSIIEEQTELSKGDIESTSSDYVLNEFGQLMSLDLEMRDQISPYYLNEEYPNYGKMIEIVNNHYPKDITDKMSCATWIQLFNVTDFKNASAKVYSKNKVLKKKKLLRVIFPDGHQIKNRCVIDTFIQVIEECNIDLVAKLGISHFGVALISREYDVKYRSFQKKIKHGYLVLSNTTTKQKYNDLVLINKELNLGMQIDLIDM